MEKIASTIKTETPEWGNQQNTKVVSWKLLSINTITKV